MIQCCDPSVQQMTSVGTPGCPRCCVTTSISMSGLMYLMKFDISLIQQTISSVAAAPVISGGVAE